MRYRDIIEGPHDPYRKKVIYLLGGPGSGKTFVSKKLLPFGMKKINSDLFVEKMARDAGVNLKGGVNYDDPNSPLFDFKRRASTLSKSQLSLYIVGNLGIVYDGTGRDYEKINKMYSFFRDLGYTQYLIFVNTDIETAQLRNSQRARTLDAKIVDKLHKEVRNNIGKFQMLFGQDKTIILDNSEGSDTPWDDYWKLIQKWIR